MADAAPKFASPIRTANYHRFTDATADNYNEPLAEIPEDLEPTENAVGINFTHNQTPLTPGNLRLQIRLVVADPDMAVKWHALITKEAAAVQAVISYVEIISYYPHDLIMNNIDFTCGENKVKPKPFIRKFLIYCAAKLIWNATQGPTWNITPRNPNLRGCQRGAQVNRTNHISFTLPLVHLFATRLNPHGFLTPENILGCNLFNREKNIKEKFEYGIWSDEEVLARMRDDNVKDNPDWIRGVYYPYALAAHRLIQNVEEPVFKGRHTHIITRKEQNANIWRENTARKPLNLNPRVPPLDDPNLLLANDPLFNNLNGLQLFI